MSVRRHALRAACCCWAAGLSLVAAAPAAADSVIDLPVAFEVKNTNASEFPCPSDGAEYTVRGRLVGPRSALESAGPRAATVYLHGFNVGGFMWRPPGFPELDHVGALAGLGHVGLVIDMLGYDSSGHPHGMQACFGSLADVTHQMVDQLHRGDYAVSGGRPTTFSKVVLAGHDAGAAVADIEAYSWDDVDGLVHLTWADQGFTQDAYAGYAPVAANCAAGGHQAEQGPPAREEPAGGPYGYVLFLDDEKIRAEQINTEPRVVDRLSRLWNRNPCGVELGVPQVTRTNPQKLPEIKVPILYGFGEQEFLWTREGLDQQTQLFSGSKDVSSVMFRGTGHFPQFSRRASEFHATVAEWLRSRRFLSAGALTSDGCPAANRTAVGAPGGGLLHGTPAADNLIGRGGADRLAARTGDDCVKGDGGRDRLRGEDGGDLVAGGAGRDLIWGGAGNDQLDGGAQADRLRGGPGRDLVAAGPGRDRIHAADGERDRVRCGPGRDRVSADRLDRLSRCERVSRPSRSRARARR